MARRRSALTLLLALAAAACFVRSEAKPLSRSRRLQEDAAADSTWRSIFGSWGEDPTPHAPPAAQQQEQQQQRGAGGGGGSCPGQLPPPPDYTWMLNATQRARGVTYLGSAERLRAALARAESRKRLSVAVVGGSITAGAGSYDSPTDAWVDRLEAFLRRAYSPRGVNVTVNNGAVPGTTSAFMCACYRRHVPEDADVVFVEYAVNDDDKRDPTFNNAVRRPFERLLRKLLAMPSRPAVVLLNAYAWFKADQHEGVFWSSAEREYQELAWYYSLPTLSVKACCYADMVAGTKGFEVRMPRELNQELHGRAFYYDYIHPDGATGHRVMAELAMHLLDSTSRDLRGPHPLTPADEAGAAAPVPRPMVRDNHAALHDTCFVGQLFKDKTVVEDKGWKWVNEAKGPRPKWGYVATEPGKVLKLRLNTTAAAGLRDKPVLVQLAHLRSYQHMGWAEVSCASGCECPPTRFNGHAREKKSLLVLHNMFATQHPECVLAVEVLPDTDSGEHKVKIAGAIVSEHAGQQEGLANAGAVEHVHDISFRRGAGAGRGVFDIRNHV